MVTDMSGTGIYYRYVDILFIEGGAVFVPNMVGFLCDCRKLQVNLRINDMLKAE